MSFWRLVRSSLAFHWRVNLAVTLGVAAATAVLTGALVVGDSMRASLERLTLERLGRIDQVVLAEGMFRQQLADELARQPPFQKRFGRALPAVLLEGTL
jgi:hypothetical protein